MDPLLIDQLCSEGYLHFLIPPNLPAALLSATQSALAPSTLPPPPATASPVKWHSPGSSAFSVDVPYLTIHLPQQSGTPRQIAWHRRGDYLATVCAYGLTSGYLYSESRVQFLASVESQTAVWIHQMTRRHSQAPFKRIRGSVQLVLFHPSKPDFFVAVSIRRYGDTSRASLTS